MRRHRRYAALLGALLVPPFALSACGGGVPGNAVATVGGDPITKSTFDHWLLIAARAQSQMTGGDGANAVAPDPPEFKRCIAAKRKAEGDDKKSRSSDATLRRQCQSEYDQLRDQVMQFHINAAWIQGEAADEGIKISDQEVKRAFDQQRKQAFPDLDAYKEFLKNSGYTQEDLLYQIKVQQLSDKLRRKILEGTDKVTDEEIRDYYNEHKDEFGDPERRDLRIILTRTRDKAEEAKRLLEQGRSWKDVAKRYSIDEGSKRAGGELRAVPKGQQEKNLDKAVFSAQPGRIVGPVKTPLGFYVFEVFRVTPAKQRSLSESKESIRQILVSQKQQKATEEFTKNYEKKWKSRTECRKGFVIEACKNAPKTTTTATTGEPTEDAPPANSSR